MARILIEGKPVFHAGDYFPFSVSGHLLLIFQDDTGHEFVVRGGAEHDPPLEGVGYGKLVIEPFSRGRSVPFDIQLSHDRRVNSEGYPVTAESRGSIEVPLGGRS